MLRALIKHLECEGGGEKKANKPTTKTPDEVQNRGSRVHGKLYSGADFILCSKMKEYLLFRIQWLLGPGKLQYHSVLFQIAALVQSICGDLKAYGIV